jgi:hypothetical protein
MGYQMKGGDPMKRIHARIQRRLRRRRSRATPRRDIPTTAELEQQLRRLRAVPISALQLQHEVERIRENQDVNATSHRFSPPPSAA